MQTDTYIPRRLDDQWKVGFWDADVAFPFAFAFFVGYMSSTKLGFVLCVACGHKENADINAAITNICRCGTYPRIRRAVKLAGAILRGEERVVAAPPPGIAPDDAARAVPALTPVAPK